MVGSDLRVRRRRGQQDARNQKLEVLVVHPGGRGKGWQGMAGGPQGAGL